MKRARALALAFALAPAFLPGQVCAQSLENWSLPTPEATSGSQTEQGPIDAQNPAVLKPGSTANPASSLPTAPPPSPVPIITPPPPAPKADETGQADRTSRAASAPTPGSAVRPATHERAPVAAPNPTPAETVSATEAPPVPAQGPTATTPPVESAEGNAPASATGWPIWWWGIPAGLGIAALGLFLFMLRRRMREAEWEEVEEETRPAAETEERTATPVAAPVPAPAPAAPISRQSLPTPDFTPKPPPVPASASPAIKVTFEPVAMRISLVYATLQYRLGLNASAAQGPVNVLGDLISAHASLSQEEQLAPLPRALPALHSLTGLVPGETISLKGEIQIPLSQVRALRKGDASFFVPLARLCLTGEGGTGLRRVFVLGIPGGAQGLTPLRLDAGTGNVEGLAAREIEAARQIPLQTGPLPLDPQRVAG
jgi:hypothetical protein